MNVLRLSQKGLLLFFIQIQLFLTLPRERLTLNFIISILPNFHVILTQIRSISCNWTGFLILILILLFWQSLCIIVTVNCMMVEKLTKWDHWCKLELFSKTTTDQMDENPPVILFGKHLSLENLMFLFYYWKSSPFFFETVSVVLGCTFYCQIFEFIQIFFRPESYDINFFRKMFDQMIPYIRCLFLAINIK